MSAYGSPDRLAGVADLTHVTRDSGKASGNLRRPRRSSRRLLRMFYLSAQVAAACCPESKRFYQRKHAEGKSHKQAVLALARRRLNVLWGSDTGPPDLRNHRGPGRCRRGIDQSQHVSTVTGHHHWESVVTLKKPSEPNRQRSRYSPTTAVTESGSR
ncbi:transposase [Streptomyces sp. NPDC048281]|uniref:transposase n=1 Tax=Streptomyces sp. NPDC048281 TaxID=3154715 RepID=UPI00342F5783